MKKSLPISIIYLLILGASIGAIIATGALSAPVIFSSDSIIPELGMTKFDMGRIMSVIFSRLNIFLNITAIIILIYELLSFNLGGKKNYFALLINAISVILIFLFTFYYTGAILAAQAQGAAATATPEFDSLHQQSELIFKTLLITLSISFIWNAMKLCKENKTTTTKAK